MKAILIALVLVSASASAEAIFVKGKPGNEVTKLEVLKALITSDNKAVYYKCQPQEVSSKGTVKNK